MTWIGEEQGVISKVTRNQKSDLKRPNMVKKVTKCDMGEAVSKNAILRVTHFLNSPLWKRIEISVNALLSYER